MKITKKKSIGNKTSEDSKKTRKVKKSILKVKSATKKKSITKKKSTLKSKSLTKKKSATKTNSTTKKKTVLGSKNTSRGKKKEFGIKNNDWLPKTKMDYEQLLSEDSGFRCILINILFGYNDSKVFGDYYDKLVQIVSEQNISICRKWEDLRTSLENYKNDKKPEEYREMICCNSGNDDRVKALLRHLRNSIAHNRFVLDDEYYYFEDVDGDYISARIVLKKQSILKIIEEIIITNIGQ